MSFHIGTLVHAILEDQARHGGEPEIEAMISVAEDQLESQYRSVVGAGWSDVERVVVQESRLLVTGMMDRYFQRWGTSHPLGEHFRYVHAELTFRIPIPGTENHLRGTIDGVAVDDLAQQVWLVEHKTFGDYPAKLEDLQVNYQLLAYCWAAWQLLGYPVAGIIYDGISKKVPHMPDIVERGKRVSRQWITTTGDMYREAIRSVGGDVLDPYYADILAKLDARDESREGGFFIRHRLRFTREALRQFESELVAIAEMMSDTDVKIIPNFIWQGCYDCGFRDLCTATQLREDVEWIVQERYQSSIGWRTIRAEPVDKLVLDIGGNDADNG